MANPMYGQNKDDNALDLLVDMQADNSGLKISHASSDFTAISATHTVDTAIAAITQPAGTFLKDLIFVSNSNISSSGVSGDGMDVVVGTAAGGAQLMAATEIWDDGGSAVTLNAYAPIYIFENGHGQPANSFIGSGMSASEATVPAASLFSASAREIHVTFQPIDADLTATGSIKVICVFQHTSI